jgi:hypothetical protein
MKTHYSGSIAGFYNICQWNFLSLHRIEQANIQANPGLLFSAKSVIPQQLLTPTERRSVLSNPDLEQEVLYIEGTSAADPDSLNDPNRKRNG